MIDSPADAAGRTPRAHKPRGPDQVLETKHDVLMPDLRKQAEDTGRDPEELDPLADDEDAGRRASLGGSTSLD
jgi:hypothetical protein